MLHSKKILRILTDIFALNFSFLFVNLYLNPNELWIKDTVTLGVIINLLWFATLAASNKLYSRFEYTRFRVEIKSVLKNYILHFAFFSLYYIKIIEGNWLFLALYYVLLFFLVLSMRFIMHLFLPRLRQITTLHYVVIGSCKALKNVEETIRHAHLNKVKYMGSFGKRIPKKYKKIGEVEQIYTFLKEHPYVNQVVYASSEMTSKQLRKLMNYCKLNFIDFKIIPLEVDLLGTGIKMELHDGFPLLAVRDENIARLRNRFVKRLFDVVFSLVIILVLLWLFIPVIAILIKRESKGPLFFKQTRRGFKNQLFTCYKFRSMVVNDTADTQQATVGDRRITKIGAFMRRTNIDELPQFFNVLKGDMSVVGPRPHPLKLDEDLSNEMEEYILRYYTKPGITGWAQVNGFRGPTETQAAKEGRSQHDLWYLRNWNVWLDIKIIFLTVFGSKSRDNAF